MKGKYRCTLVIWTRSPESVKKLRKASFKNGIRIRILLLFFFNPFQNGSECESAGRSLSSIGSF